MTVEKQIPSCSISLSLSLSFFICQFESQAGGTSAHSTATMPTIFCSPPLSLQPLPPCHSEPRSTRRRTICHPSVQALTHSRFKFRKRFRFAVGDPSANANYPDPLSTTFWFRPMSAASLFFCNPASASRCRHPHPDGNVTLWHRIHEKKEEEEKLGSFQLPLPLRPAACTQHVE